MKSILLRVLVPTVLLVFLGVNDVSGVDHDCFQFDDDLDTGALNTELTCLVEYQGDWYVGGYIPTVGGQDAGGIARWNGNDWEPLATILTYSGLDFLKVETMCVMDDGQGGGPQLYVGGRFDGAGGLEVYNIARWNGSTWSRPGYGVDGRVRALAWVDGDEGGINPPLLIAGGDFQHYRQYVAEGSWTSVPCKHIAMWYLGQWWPLHEGGTGLNGVVRSLYTMEAAEPLGRGICIGGDFTATADSLQTDLNHFAIYRYYYPGQYDTPAASRDFGPDPTIRAFTLFDDGLNGMHVYFGGDFDNFGDPCNLMGWNGTAFNVTSGLDGPVYALGACDSYYWNNPVLYVGGKFNTVDVAFTSPDLIPASNLVMWRDGYWKTLCSGSYFGNDCPENGTNDLVNFLYPLAQGGSDLNSVIVGGSFGEAGGEDHDHITTWEPTDWVTIVADPVNMTACEGTPASFTVAASGTAELSYQWLYRELGSSAAFDTIPDATDATLVIPAVADTNAGLYLCEVSNVCGTRSSTSAELTIGYAPVITKQPYLADLPCLGETMYIKAEFDAATYPEPTWTWYRDGVEVESSEFHCQTFMYSAEYADEGYYHVVIQNQCGTAVSDSVQLVLSEAPTITQHPQSQTIRVGDPVEFTADADGTEPEFQWHKDEEIIAGAGDTEYSIGAVDYDDIGDYVMAAYNFCDSVLTSTATLTVVANEPPVAVATADPTRVYLGEEIFFDGTGSSDHEGHLEGYAWDFGDGIGTSTEDSPTYIYPVAGEYEAVLTVSDDRADTGADAVQVAVSNCLVEPAALDFGTVLVDEPESMTFTVTNLGAAPFDIDVSVVSEVFSVTGGGLATVDPGLPHEVTIEFAPTESGAVSCEVDVGYFLAATVPCSGRGVAAIVDYTQSSASVLVPPDGISVLNHPAGTGDPLNNCYTEGGSRTDATITLTLIDPLGEPIPDYPESEVYLVSNKDGLYVCPDDPAHPDGPTNLDGETTFSGPLFAGGYSDSNEFLLVVIAGQVLTNSPLPILFNSPDISGEGVVNLVDVTHFATDFYGGADPYRSDFYWDDHVNLSDIGLMAQALSKNCPADKAAPDRREEREAAGTLAFYADSRAEETSLFADPGEPFTVHLVLTGHGAQSVRGWECRVQSTSNLRFLAWELAGGAVNVQTPPEFIVGLGSPLPAAGPVLLATARCQVTDDQPAALSVAPAGLSSFYPPEPGIAAVSDHDKSRLVETGVGEPLRINPFGQATENGTGPEQTALLPAAPNPFNPQTLIRFEMPAAGRVLLTIYSVDGRRVRTLLDEVRNSGQHEVYWNGRDDGGRAQASGAYFYRLTTDDFQATRRMVLLR